MIASDTVRKIKIFVIDNFTFDFPLMFIHNKTKKISVTIKHI